MVGVEGIRFDPEKKGVFQYDMNAPYTHSLAGIATMGAAMAGYHYVRSRRVWDALVVFLVTLSHFVLEIPAHRPGDLSIYPYRMTPDHVPCYSLFDHRNLTFLLESTLLMLATAYYTTTLPREARRPATTILTTTFVPQLLLLCYGALPTTNATYVHAPLLLAANLATIWALRGADVDNAQHVGKLAGDMAEKAKMKSGEIKGQVAAKSGQIKETVVSKSAQVQEQVQDTIAAAADKVGKVVGAADGVAQGKAASKEE